MKAADAQSNSSCGLTCQHGFTLVELMIAMTIGLFLSAGIIALFLGTKQSYRSNEGMARVQESGRFAIEYLGKDLREAGFRDFDYNATPLTNDVAINVPIRDEPIRGWQGASSDPSSESLTTYTAETDVFRIRYSHYKSPPDVNPAALVGDQILYYIGPPSGGGEPGLRQKINADNSQELLEGVYDMQVRYGQDTDGDSQPDSYIDADSVTDWTQVVAVRLDLLLGSSEDNLVDTSMSLPFENNDGSFFTAADRRIYQSFSTTIALRNRLP